jgi:hypothetical protein
LICRRLLRHFSIIDSLLPFSIIFALPFSLMIISPAALRHFRRFDADYA